MRYLILSGLANYPNLSLRVEIFHLCEKNQNVIFSLCFPSINETGGLECFVQIVEFL